jgi:class 3 adenylate cyclase
MLGSHKGRRPRPFIASDRRQSANPLLWQHPRRAIHCARAIREGAQGLEIEVRVGLHTGEVERRGDDVAGIGVHIAAQVSAAASAGEILVSRTVTDLVEGSGIEFQDRGERVLKGVREPGRLFAVKG